MKNVFIDDTLHRLVKIKAAEIGSSITEIVEKSVRLYLADLEKQPKQGRPLPQQPPLPLKGAKKGQFDGGH